MLEMVHEGGGIQLPQDFYVISIRGETVEKHPLIFTNTHSALPRHGPYAGTCALFLKKSLWDLLQQKSLRGYRTS